MAIQRPDPDSLAAARAHWTAWHHSPIVEGEIAIDGNGRASDVRKVTLTPETTTSSAWFTCHECPAPAQRFRVDAGADPICPPSRHLAAIRRHLREAHGLRRLPRRRIHDGVDAPGMAIYVPSTALHGAHLICGMCRTGSNDVTIEEPPYGDARSFSLLVMLYPGLACEIASLDVHARATRLEAYHRAMVIPSATQRAIDRVLRTAGDGSSVPAQRDVDEAIRTLLATSVAMGTPITRTVPALVKLMDADPIVYACAVAAAIPELEVFRTRPPASVAALTRERYGCLERTERAVWTIWCGRRALRPDRRANSAPADAVCVRCQEGAAACPL
jgi:hypothetical protein